MPSIAAPVANWEFERIALFLVADWRNCTSRTGLGAMRYASRVIPGE